MLVTDVVTTRRPPLPRRMLALAILAVVVLAGVPLYQAYSSASNAGSSRTSRAFAVRLQLTMDRRDWSSGDHVRGRVVITAPDGATLQGPAVIGVYPAGLPQTSANRVATSEIVTPAVLSAAESSVLSFELDTGTLTPGSYSVNVELGAQVDKGDMHATGKTVSVAEFVIK